MFGFFFYKKLANKIRLYNTSSYSFIKGLYYSL